MTDHIHPPRGLSFEPIAADAVSVSWLPVEHASYYELRGGGSSLMRRIKSTNAVVRGLVPSHNTIIELRAAAEGDISGWSSIEVRPSTAIPTAPTNGAVIPLIDVDRQSMLLRLPNSDGQNVDVRLSFWWSPSDSSWWASLESPVNTQAVSSRRMGLNCGLLDNIFNVLAGNIVMRATGELVEDEPTRRSIAAGTHSLIWEPR